MNENLRNLLALAIAEAEGLPVTKRQLWYALNKQLQAASFEKLPWDIFRKQIDAYQREQPIPNLVPDPETTGTKNAEGIPYHCAVMYHPGGKVEEIGKTYPTRKIKGKFYCKYCYSTHHNWWQMDPKDYSGEDVILCGKCTHTSKKEFAET
jgi:hypothetical protein